jgi:OmpR-family two-component system manganese-sensing sensor histidine kinase
MRQITERVVRDHQVLGYLRVSHPWFEVTKPSRRLIWDLSLGSSAMVGVVALIGWLLSGIAMAPGAGLLPAAQAIYR